MEHNPQGAQVLQKNKKNQQFRTFDTILVVVLLLGVASISGSIVHEALRDDRIERARFRAETLAQQIVTGGVSALVALPPTDRVPDLAQQAPSRGPASVGESENETQLKDGWVEGHIGRDPWGRPFRFKLIQGREGSPLRVLVWSPGPNARYETEMSDMEWAQLSLAKKVQFQGDDIGFAYTNP
jgi:hypothetical protein